MKTPYLLIFVFAFFACESDFNLDEAPGQNYTFDDEGDPVIENVEDIENNQLGVGGGFCYGFTEPADAEIAVIEIDSTEILPIEYDISSYLPEIGNQGSQGSCVGWATGYYLKSFQENYENEMNGIFNADFQMSPSYIYNQIKVAGCENGSVIQDALDTIASQGIVDLSIMPYNQNDCDTQPLPLQKELAQPFKIENYFYLDQELVFEQTKAFLLENQPVVIAITIDRNYFGARDIDGDFIYRKYKSSDGSHAMLVVGYDDEREAFKVVNSWGRSWGNEGYVWIDYKAFKEAGDPESDFPVLCEAWIANDIVINQPASL